MPIYNHWRNKQISDQRALLKQEVRCFSWMEKQEPRIWYYQGIHGYFKTLILESFSTVDTIKNSTGVVMVNLTVPSPKQFVQKLNSCLHDQQSVYISINRFNIPPINDLGIDYVPSLEGSIDQIMEHCALPFKRLYRPDAVDGHHFVGVHGLDVFVYEHNN